MSLTSRKPRPLNRNIDHLRDTSIIWIAIEGSPNVSKEHRYFKIFQKRDRRYQLKIIGNNNNRSSPDYIIENLKNERERFDVWEDDEFWLVIDVDRWGQKKLAEVAQKCFDCGSNLAVSNPCFEVWLLYHYQEIEKELCGCGEAKQLLNEQTQNDPNSDNGYKAIFTDNKIEEAILRAKNNDNEEDNWWPNSTGSHVYKAVESILKQEV